MQAADHRGCIRRGSSPNPKQCETQVDLLLRAELNRHDVEELFRCGAHPDVGYTSTGLVFIIEEKDTFKSEYCA